MSRDKLGRFKTGNIGGPGRPAGSKNRLAERFAGESRTAKKNQFAFQRQMSGG